MLDPILPGRICDEFRACFSNTELLGDICSCSMKIPALKCIEFHERLNIRFLSRVILLWIVEEQTVMKNISIKHCFNLRM